MFDLIIRELRHATLAAGLFVALVSSGVVGAQGTGTITGTVTIAERTRRPARIAIDQRVCGRELPDESILVGGAGELANAVVTLAGVTSRRPPAAAGIVNEHCRLSPRVQVVQPGAAITTTSRDPMLHTTTAQMDGGQPVFNVPLPVPGFTITRPVNGAGIVRVRCNSHPWMQGWVVVTEEMAAVTGGDGRFTLRDVPAGTHELRIWHEALGGAPQRVSVKAGRTITADFQLR